MRWPCFQVHSRTTYPWNFLKFFNRIASDVLGKYFDESYWVTQVCGNDTIFITLGDRWKRKKGITISRCRFLSLFYFFLCGPLIIFSKTIKAAFFGIFWISFLFFFMSEGDPLHLLTKHTHTHVIAQLRTKWEQLLGAKATEILPAAIDPPLQSSQGTDHNHPGPKTFQE